LRSAVCLPPGAPRPPDLQAVGADLIDRAHLGEWLAQQTGGMLAGDAGLVAHKGPIVVSAMHFRASWRKPFDRSKTRRKRFTDDRGAVSIVRMMMSRAGRPYFTGDVAEGVRLETQGLRVDIILPRGDRGIRDLENAATPEALAAWDMAFELEDVYLELPRVSVTCAADLVKADGVLVRQHCGLVLDETGAEGAAGTVAYTLSDPVEVICDRPFLCVVRDGEGNVLMIGSIVRP
jgi:serine protease inhibitor